ncbi:MAG: hypothetical protein KA712_20670 [Myxococcales bacterium]|nr:hypothetical protein [Myxococcales bacterium]
MKRPHRYSHKVFPLILSFGVFGGCGTQEETVTAGAQERSEPTCLGVAEGRETVELCGFETLVPRTFPHAKAFLTGTYTHQWKVECDAQTRAVAKATLSYKSLLAQAKVGLSDTELRLPHEGDLVVQIDLAQAGGTAAGALPIPHEDFETFRAAREATEPSGERLAHLKVHVGTKSGALLPWTPLIGTLTFEKRSDELVAWVAEGDLGPLGNVIIRGVHGLDVRDTEVGKNDCAPVGPGGIDAPGL